MKILSASLQTYANQSWGLMLAKYTPTRFANPCPQVFVRNPQKGIFTPQQNKTRGFEKMVMSSFQRTKPDCKILKKHMCKNFLYRRSLAAEQLFEETRNGNIFGNVQCDIEVSSKSVS